MSIPFLNKGQKKRGIPKNPPFSRLVDPTLIDLHKI
jgi:hypothetical protein